MTSTPKIPRTDAPTTPLPEYEPRPKSRLPVVNTPGVRKVVTVKLSDDCTVTYRRGDKTDPLFPQWWKTVNACWNPDDENFPVFGAVNIGFWTGWFDFEQFRTDMLPTFEDRPDKPAIHRRIYLGRKNPRAGFNPQNAVWITKPQAMQYQKRTIRVETPFGKRMSLRELEQYLKDNEGEEFPDGRKYELRVREYDERDKLRTVTKIIDTIQRVPIHELRRRVRNKTDLFRPVRPYGDAEDIRMDEAVRRDDDRRERLMKMASEKGMTFQAFIRTHDDNGNPFQT